MLLLLIVTAQYFLWQVPVHIGLRFFVCFFIIMHTSSSWSMGRVMSGVCVFVCLCVRTLNGKWRELSTPNLVDVDILFMAVTWHALTLRSKVKVTCRHEYAYRYNCLGFLIFRSSPPRWPNKPGKNVRPSVRPSVRMSVRTYVRTYVHNQTQRSHKPNSGIC